ncbi:RNA polymerase sigma-D factor [Thalassobacillus devorans]|uniref:RNA polymerase sigma-D factor n=1 Tax=Thalassobacillus devorans TaxID=279813 RepID=A0ABQ1P376_9BACI|nr:FliA/WhiG family RNA polymerase sigma factor [Thalassobacillus devorans]NIK27935.1 RNA polymerase sigma factor for flagellar operon FliA [Thalassobacillus devorans]GGC90196.1 RNA polymerase sigma-D factor [Thalassobacillus devorans]
MASSLSLEEQELWNRWQQEENMEAANELIENHMDLVNFHVQRIAAHLPASVNKDDIKSLGLYGLYDALKKFDIQRDLKFDTYASFRIRGAIMDGLRKEDWLPRSVRDKAKKIEHVSERLEQKLQRLPTSKEIGEETGLEEEEVAEVVKDALFANILSMEDKTKDGSNDQTEGVGYTLPDNKSLTPEKSLVRQENHQDLADGIRQLKEKEQLVISLFYYEELTLTEIGQVLGLTTSRISQIHAKALFKLKNNLGGLINA